MKFITTALALVAILSSPLKADPELIDSPLKGFIHIRDHGDPVSADHFIRTNQIVSVTVYKVVSSERPFSISIMTTGTQSIRGVNAGGSASVKYQIHFETLEEAGAAAEKLMNVIVSAD